MILTLDLSPNRFPKFSSHSVYLVTKSVLECSTDDFRGELTILAELLTSPFLDNYAEHLGVNDQSFLKSKSIAINLVVKCERLNLRQKLSRLRFELRG